MRLPAHPILVLLVAGTAATVAVAIGACTNPDTQTPSCDNNVGPYGIGPASSGCEGFGQCYSDAAVPVPMAPSYCCVGGDGGPLAGNDLATCLHGFGDPTCAYLLSTISGDGGTNVVYTCSPTPPTSAGDGG